MKLRRRKDEAAPVTLFGFEIAPAVERERVWPATSFGGGAATPERVTVSEPQPWGHIPAIESWTPEIVSPPTAWHGTALDEEFDK